MPKSVELLAPARDLACGKTAVDCGADAVYIGAPRFGAREQAGNSLEDVAQLARYARRFWARVYVTLNTLLFDHEIPPALELIRQCYDMGIDGLIIQDAGLLELDLPPIPLIASTQMHNHTPERAAFLEQLGFHRIILARELSLDQIREIRRAAPRIELEYFVHGALCVCYSGRCSMSAALGGRSANRGQCAQPCRKIYSLADAQGNILQSERHLLSIRDLNLSDHLGELLEAGISSFKIEGRLKDEVYVANVTAYYRRRLDEALPRAGLKKSSSGASTVDFSPDPRKTFNRGFTTYFLHGRRQRIGSIDAPKMIGEAAGRVLSASKRSFTIDGGVEFHPGDGICFFDRRRRLRGALINAVHGREIVPSKMDGVAPGLLIHRNHDHRFLEQVRKSRKERRISIQLVLKEIPGGLLLEAVDEDGVRAEYRWSGPLEPAKKPEQAMASMQRQLEKTGDSIFTCVSLRLDLPRAVFMPIAGMNELRRRVLDALEEARSAARPVAVSRFSPHRIPYPEKELSHRGNVLNRHAENFYRRRGVLRIEPAAESGLDLSGRVLMTTKYCLKYERGCCPKQKDAKPCDEPLFLIDEEGRRFPLRFDCERCVMEILAPDRLP